MEVRTLRLEMYGPKEPLEMVAVATPSGRRTEEATEQPTAREATPAPLPAAEPSAAPAVDELGNQVDRAPHPPATPPEEGTQGWTYGGRPKPGYGSTPGRQRPCSGRGGLSAAGGGL